MHRLATRPPVPSHPARAGNESLSKPLRALALTLTLALPFRPPASSAESSPDSAPLVERLTSELGRPAFARATWGVRVIRADTGASLFETNAHRLLKPASTAKLFTAALVLDLFGPHHRLRTDLVPRGRISRSGTLHGDLVLFGRGDFSAATRFTGETSAPALQPLVDALTRAGIRRIDGALVADDSHFTGVPFGTGWTWDDLHYSYGAPVSALTTGDNVIDLVLRPGSRDGDPVTVELPLSPSELHLRTSQFRTGPAGSARRVTLRHDPGTAEVVLEGSLPAGGEASRESVPVTNPALHFAGRLGTELAGAGIPVTRGIRHEPGAARRPATRAVCEPIPAIAVESPPLSLLVRHMLKPSQNLYAQLLLLQAGTTEPPQSAEDSSESRGLRAMRGLLGRADIPADEVLLDDGSGLSRSALVTPNALVALLRHADHQSWRDAFLDGLPLAGVDGSLRTRFRGGPAEGNLRAKTGSFRYVSTLSGQVTNAAGHRLLFAVLLNAYDPPPGGPSGRDAVEQVAELLARSRE